LETKSNILKKSSKTKETYKLKIGDMCVEMLYAENNKSLNDCMLNILKQKVKVDWYFIIEYVTLHQEGR